MSERYLRGIEIAEQLAAEKLEEFTTSRVAELAPDFARMAIEFPLGDIYGRDGLDLRSREIVAISSLATLGNAGPQLRIHIRAATKVGLTTDRDHRNPDADRDLRGLSRRAQRVGIVPRPVDRRATLSGGDAGRWPGIATRLLHECANGRRVRPTAHRRQIDGPGETWFDQWPHDEVGIGYRKFGKNPIPSPALIIPCTQSSRGELNTWRRNTPRLNNSFRTGSKTSQLVRLT